MRVLALASYPERMAATRFRMAKYIPYLARRGIDVEMVSWLDDAAAARLYDRGARVAKALGSAAGTRRVLRAATGPYDAVWIQREAMLWGPPLVEALVLARGMPLVLDYDDAIWIPQSRGLRGAVRAAWKADWTLSRAAHALPGSTVLANRAAAAGVPFTILRTVVESSVWTPLACRGSGTFHQPDRPVIGWIGTHSTASQLELAAPALRRLRDEGRRFELRIVGAPPGFTMPGLDCTRAPWSLERDVDDFRGLDVGLAPMHDSEWHDGKCAFKQVQYMAVGVPQVTSWVGAARDFVIDGANALVARTAADWYRHLAALLDDTALRARLSQAGRALVERSLCTERQVEPLATALRSAASRR